MLDPAPGRGFLDVGGAWDPSHVFVAAMLLGMAAHERHTRCSCKTVAVRPEQARSC
jgi:hypothetical protein